MLDYAHRRSRAVSVGSWFRLVSGVVRVCHIKVPVCDAPGIRREYPPRAAVAAAAVGEDVLLEQ